MSTGAPPAGARVGVFLCRCGGNISDSVDVGSLVEAAGALPGVVVVREGGFLCADAGQRLIRDEIRREGLTGVVTAGCSPQVHEATFQRVVREAGLNPARLQIANIREQVSWVTAPGEQATAKAAALVAAAVARVAHHRALEARQVPVSATALVVGGGIAGIEAALRIAGAGRRVVLVEREPSLGGRLARLARTFPTLDCAACTLVPKMAEIAAHPLVEVLTTSEVASVAGHVGSFRVGVRTRPRFVDAAACTGCGLCVEACPLGELLSEADEGLGARTAAHFPFPQAVPWVPVVDRGACARAGPAGCRACADACPAGAVDFEQAETEREIEAGAIVLAVGARLFAPRRAPELGFGRWPNVVTSMQLERMLHPSGPTGGRVLLRDGRPPRSVAFLHCVGSRDRRHNRHCSRICCTTAMKLALLVRQQTGARVTSFVIDVRAAGKRAEEFYEQVQRAGVTFVHGRGAEVFCRGGTLMVKAEDQHLGRQAIVPADMVVLAVGMEAEAGAAELGARFGVSCGEQGFLAEQDLKFAPVRTAAEGVFLAGACQGPKDIPESVAQAGAAAAAVLELMDRGVVEIMPHVAEVDPELCSGCRVCLDACPAQALAMADAGGREVARVAEVLCRGCGACVAACPAGAITQLGYTSEQLDAEIAGALGP